MHHGGTNMLIGIDGGGTKTDLILLEKDGGKNIIGPASKQIVAEKLIKFVTTLKESI